MKFDITTDEGIEKLIHHAQKHGCSISIIDLKEREGKYDVVIETISSAARHKLWAYGVMQKEKVNGCYPLTEKGIHFKSFKDEDEKAELLNKKLKLDAKISERVVKTYPSTQIVTWVTFGLALGLGYLQIAQALKWSPYHK